MTKHLIFHWYIPDTPWSDIYQLHLINLEHYHNVFDKATIIINRENIQTNEYKARVENTVKKLKDIFPAGEFVTVTNDPKLGEAKYFYNEIATKLHEFPKDELIFFAHNKGQFSWYEPMKDLLIWINVMYFANLHNIAEIDKIFEDTTKCCAGTISWANCHAWTELKYNWHYSGTFFWFSPYRIINEIIQNREQMASLHRYFAEAFLGSVVKPEHAEFILGERDPKRPHGKEYWINERMTPEDKKEFEDFYGKV